MFTNDKMYFCKGCEIENAKKLYNDFVNDPTDFEKNNVLPSIGSI